MTAFKIKPKAFSRRIQVRKGYGQEIIESQEWRNMTLDFVIRWDWFITYKAALLQIKYPKYKVEIVKWDQDPVGKTKLQIQQDLNKKRTTTCKRMITKISNLLSAYEKEQRATLLPNFENEGYLNAKKKLQNYKDELETLKQLKL